MVYSGDGGEGLRDLVMAMGPERSKPPLHNFNLPCLKWGNQRQLRCMKVSDSTDPKESNNSNKFTICITDRQRCNRSPLSKSFSKRNFDVHRFKSPKPRIDGAGGVCEGIEAVREKIMFDLKTAANKMKDAILKKEASSDDDDEEDVHDNEHEKMEERQSPAPAAASEAVVGTEQEVRSWNLRTRRAACKVAIGVNSVTGKGLMIEKRKLSNYSPLRSEGAKSPRLRGEKREGKKEKEENEVERAKLSVPLSKEDIEEDFMAMVGHRPARRPKKRPRTVQKQWDWLSPALWLTEVTVDTYKVPEIPDNGKQR